MLQKIKPDIYFRPLQVNVFRTLTAKNVAPRKKCRPRQLHLLPSPLRYATGRPCEILSSFHKSRAIASQTLSRNYTVQLRLQVLLQKGQFQTDNHVLPVSLAKHCLQCPTDNHRLLLCTCFSRGPSTARSSTFHRRVISARIHEPVAQRKKSRYKIIAQSRTFIIHFTLKVTDH